MNNIRYQHLLKPIGGNLDPAQRFIFEELAHRRLTLKDFAELSGISESSLSRQRAGQSRMFVIDLRAALNTLGLDIAIIKQEK